MIGGTDIHSAAINEEDDEFFESQHGSRSGKRSPGPSAPNLLAEGAVLNDQDPDYWSTDMGWFKFRSMPFDVELFGGWFRFNPVVFSFSVIGIVAFLAYCLNDPKTAVAEIKTWKTWIADNFTWFYIGSVGAFFIFDAYLMFSRFGGIVLGKPGVPPRFSTASWFAMLFSAGIGIGLFYYGVSEPIYHYVGPNRWSKLPRYERAIAAMNVSWFHWGLAPSACYAIVGLPIAFYAHRLGMPCSMRTVFYPLMGSSIHGIVGDIIDISAVMGTLFGICTSLGFGVSSIASGLDRIYDDFDNNLTNRNVIIIVITIFATISVATGLDYGIRRLSEGNFMLGLFVVGVLAMAGDTFFLLDMFVETAGTHLWSLLDLEFHTDAFADNARIVGRNAAGDYAKANWMDGWTVFYWGWWISWAPFVGVFIAQISKGRTVREFVLGNVFVPSLLTSLWFTVYGGLGLEMELQAEALGLGGNYHLHKAYTKYATNGVNTFNLTEAGGYGLPAQETYVDTGTKENNFFKVYTGPTNNVIRPAYDPKEADYAYNQPICPDKGENVYANVEGRLVWRLSCRGHESRLWDVIEANCYGMRKFMMQVTVIAIVTYFVTSSDSGSMVCDMLCSNGIAEPPVLQRIFWATAEGAVTIALTQGDNAADSTKALQTVSIAAGLIFCFMMVGMMIATYQMFIDLERADPDFMKRQEKEVAVAQQAIIDAKGHPKRFKRRILEYVNQTIMGVFCCGKPNILDTAIAIVAPCLVDYQTLTAAGLNPLFGTITAGSFFFLFVLFHILEVAERGLWTFAWMFYFIFIAITTLNRSTVRSKYNLRGDAMCDCCIVFWWYPCAVMQLNQEVEELKTTTKAS